MEEIDWSFGVIGNIISQHTDQNGNIYYGTKAFTANTKVYIDGKHWNKDRKEISVIGRNRFGQMVLESIPSDLIENVRAKRIFDPQVLELMHRLQNMDGWGWWGRTANDRRDTEKFAKEFNQKQQKQQ